MLTKKIFLKYIFAFIVLYHIFIIKLTGRAAIPLLFRGSSEISFHIFFMLLYCSRSLETLKSNGEYSTVPFLKHVRFSNINSSEENFSFSLSAISSNKDLFAERFSAFFSSLLAYPSSTSDKISAYASRSNWIQFLPRVLGDLSDLSSFVFFFLPGDVLFFNKDFLGEIFFTFDDVASASTFEGEPFFFFFFFMWRRRVFDGCALIIWVRNFWRWWRIVNIVGTHSCFADQTVEIIGIFNLRW